MFRAFNLNKFRYEKGQLLPVFIVILAVLIIMALVTVNLGKISMTKTYTSNAADAGALAGGSVMAGVFNQQSVTNNNSLVINHTMFMAEMFTLAAAASASAFAAAAICSSTPPELCGPSGVCEVLAGAASKSIKAAMISLVAFQVAQVFTYLSMKEGAMTGRENAIRTAYQYAFSNSGIGTKLIPGAYKDADTPRGNENNYSDSFTDFMKNKDLVTSGVYSWEDGQGRAHVVTVNVDTHDVDTYLLQYCVLPYLAVEAYLASQALPAAAKLLVDCAECPCTAGPAYMAAMKVTVAMLAAAAGTLPYGPLMEHNLFGDIAFLIAWVDDIDHDRLFYVTSWQTHGDPYDYDSLWKARYPKIGSRSKVNFKGEGTIYPFGPKFDSDIEEVK